MKPRAFPVPSRTSSLEEFPSDRLGVGKNIASVFDGVQTSRLENPEELQLNYNHEKFLFLTALLLLT
jgi:hypothetical protein